MAFIEIDHIRKIYRKATVTVPAVNDISFDIDKGEFLAIIGKSGSGKSTLLNLLGGLDTPTSGEIRFEGANLFAEGKDGLVKHRRHRVGMVFQSFQLIPGQTAAENIELALAFGGVSRSERKARALELLAQVGLAERADHYPAELSGGEAQRVAIARALANDPAILLADEPTGNLDTQNGDIVLGILQDLHRQGRTIIMITHDPDMARVAQRTIRMQDGQLLDSQLTHESLNAKAL
ncbi:MAG: ABC transporter ATP-binding protein [Lewinellaceae bacterium]|nr:ABC transporter ATP-binding protein [Saprospiraceae bacterium]MCB9312686.1 ABC transporter ATP-binding protein [Lewinellaceae bacterium]